MHQFMCNVSNQAYGAAEDAINKPWRPVPAGRITEEQAFILRWIVVAMCTWYSAAHGVDLVLVTLGLFVTTFLYDEMGLAAHHVGKNFCNIGGYTTFEIGATKLMGMPNARSINKLLKRGESRCQPRHGSNIYNRCLCQRRAHIYYNSGARLRGRGRG